MRSALTLILAMLPALSFGAQVSIDRIRAWPAPDHTRVVFDVGSPVEHTLFMLKNPDRVVVDLRQADLAAELPSADRDDRLLARMRAGKRPGGDLRVVFDLHGAVRPRSFLLKPNAQYGHRLVIDLQAEDAAAKPAARRPVLPEAGPRDLVVALDPGHGGEDPGALGPARTRPISWFSRTPFTDARSLIRIASAGAVASIAATTATAARVTQVRMRVLRVAIRMDRSTTSASTRPTGAACRRSLRGRRRRASPLRAASNRPCC